MNILLRKKPGEKDDFKQERKGERSSQTQLRNREKRNVPKG
jgi:hypothetical protein